MYEGGYINDNLSVHLLSFCHGNETKRQQLWRAISESQRIQSYKRMMNLEIKEQCSYILQLATKNGDFELDNYAVAIAVSKLVTYDVTATCQMSGS